MLVLNVQPRLLEIDVAFKMVIVKRARPIQFVKRVLMGSMEMHATKNVQQHVKMFQGGRSAKEKMEFVQYVKMVSMVNFVTRPVVINV